ncbi:PEP-CTERM sorting domain-containing protein [Alteromonas flava]|uniref:PEP-CTERM sorting domain-containing protein n=1 Tax=Alteromonas flava TaxID=2048003 RepID=UPI000C28B71B|nr:PEP-CTERM sorting domain-containing protein [Alteromonas flava]
MTLKVNKQAGILVAAAVASAFAASTANATHFRGAAIVPSVDATGLVTLTAKSFWRRSTTAGPAVFPHGSVDEVGNLSVGGDTNVTLTSQTLDISDVRRGEMNETFTYQLPGAGLYTITWNSGSWVGGVPNAGGNYGTTSTIFWDGESANTPIQFDLENIQQQVIGGLAYSDNLDAVGVGLTYDDTFLSTGVDSQARGFDIDASGQINISAANTALYTDNGSNLGADEAFSGKINAGDGSSVEFVWLFDTVNSQNANLAPSITDVVINALVGDTISETLVVTDPNAGDVLTTSFISFLGAGGAVGGSTFDPNTLEFDWDSSGFAAGTYVATFGVSDGSLSDQGTVTINLRNRSTNPSVSEPSTLAIAGLGMLGLAAMRRRRKAK